MNELTIACLCPPDGSRHPAGDVVKFREKLGFRIAATARKSMAYLKNEDPDTSVPDVLAMLSEFYLLYCIESWTLRDAKGKPLEVNKANVREYVLSNDEAAYALSDYADDLYTDLIFDPLVRTVLASSRPTPTNGSTSAKNGSGKSPKRSKPSSTASTPTAVIAPI